jgi:hypothetical protein
MCEVLDSSSCSENKNKNLSALHYLVCFLFFKKEHSFSFILLQSPNLSAYCSEPHYLSLLPSVRCEHLTCSGQVWGHKWCNLKNPMLLFHPTFPSALFPYLSNGCIFRHRRTVEHMLRMAESSFIWVPVRSSDLHHIGGRNFYGGKPVASLCWSYNRWYSEIVNKKKINVAKKNAVNTFVYLFLP